MFHALMHRVEHIRRKYELLAPVMDERMTRLWAAAEAMVLGHGGSAAVTKATGILSKRISAGKQDLEELEREGPTSPPREQRVRRPGAGRKRVVDLDPELVTALDALIDPVTRGDPQSPLRWTSKSTRQLAKNLTAHGHSVGPTTVRALLQGMGYRLQANRKTREGSQHPDRDAQFRLIHRRVQAMQRQGQPVISVDT